MRNQCPADAGRAACYHGAMDADEEVPCCAGSLAEGILARPLPALDDLEGERLPESLPPVIDGHVHLFPPRLFNALWRWFDRWGWPVRYQLHADEVVRFLKSRGVTHLVALHYAHQPGLARPLNAFMADLVARHEGVTGLATVYPGEPDAEAILSEAFDRGLRGVKLHCHVQCMAPDDPRLEPVYALCAARALPVIIHAGREPKSPGYDCDPYALCAVERVEAVLRAYPALRLCVPHFGADEFDGYARLVQRHDNLWLDTTMMAADYFPLSVPVRRLLDARPERVLYGSDFPNLPYAWDREIRQLVALKLPEERLACLLGGAARALYVGGPDHQTVGTSGAPRR